MYNAPIVGLLQSPPFVGSRAVSLRYASAVGLSSLVAVSVWIGGEKPVAADDTTTTSAKDGVTRIVLLPPGPDNPRNSEGDFIRSGDGRVMFVYTHFTGGGGDHSAGHLAARYSSDGGRTWSSEDVIVVPNEGGWNIMSVSLLRLADGRIALFYLRKNSLTDCRPCLRFSGDEGKTWSQPKVCIEDQVGYYVLNNDRAVQLTGGRILLPVALHNTPQYEKPDWAGKIMCYLSDDAGGTWRRSKDQLIGTSAGGGRVTLQEPGVIELKDGRLMMFCRTTSGCQYVSYSTDRGESWSPFGPSEIISPCSPASIERIPSTGDLLLVWNNHHNVDAAHRGKRTPYNVAVSRDEGRSWEKVKTLEDDPHGWYCYTAVCFVGKDVLLGHCAGDRRKNGLATTQITRFSVDWLYK